ncbi:uncharacterized protein LOC141607526 [Silene latifolia]|uniref:uncharacterized protein LOC141607526 n=1 Tax=Silene latifolia TaxID=37657 RepID=UPI003D77CBF6
MGVVAVVEQARQIRFSSEEFETNLNSILEDEELIQEIPEEAIPETPAPLLLRIIKDDVEGESNGVDRVSFLPNGIFLVRFNTKEQQQLVLKNGHLIFDNKPVIIKEWMPDAELLKHDVSRVPIWMKIYGLDIKFWGAERLRKLSGIVGQFIKCDEATTNKAFLGYARVMIEIQIGQHFPSELNLIDENSRIQRARLVYDWLPTTCSVCKGMGHTSDICRKGENVVGARKVWRPKVPTQQ